MKKNKLARPSIFLIVITSLIVLTCKSTAGFPNPFATVTPNPTTTPTPTPTDIPNPTPTLTSSPVPTGVLKQAQPDGSTLFTDYDNKYEIVFPAGWTAISLTAKDLNDMMALASKNNPELENTITSLKAMDPKVFRTFAFDFRTGHLVNGFASNISVVAEDNSIINGMTLQDVLNTTAQSVPQMFKGGKVISSNVTKTASDIPIGVLGINLPLTTASGSKIPVYEQMVVFKMPEVVVEITLGVPKSTQSKYLSEFKQVIDSIEILK
jgi:hypothetical protein